MKTAIECSNAVRAVVNEVFNNVEVRRFGRYVYNEQRKNFRRVKLFVSHDFVPSPEKMVSLKERLEKFYTDGMVTVSYVDVPCVYYYSSKRYLSVKFYPKGS